jgi:hypothetical protein
MNNEIKKSSEDWLKEYPGLEIMDPDGWDRSNFDESWAELITEEEFNARVLPSTICLKLDSVAAKKGLGVDFSKS